MLKALDASIEHWYQNLSMLILNYELGSSLITSVSFDADDCDLCSKSPGCTNTCPLGKYYAPCNKTGYAWEIARYWKSEYFVFAEAFAAGPEKEFKKFQLKYYRSGFKAISNMINKLLMVRGRYLNDLKKKSIKNSKRK